MTTTCAPKAEFAQMTRLMLSCEDLSRVVLSVELSDSRVPDDPTRSTREYAFYTTALLRLEVHMAIQSAIMIVKHVGNIEAGLSERDCSPFEPGSKRECLRKNST